VPERVLRTRRRGVALEHAILDAALRELVQSGYVGLTMERVARAAGTNKNAVYRRWSSRAALAVAAYRRLAVAELEPPETGDLREDALALLRHINGDLASPRTEILRSLLARATQDAELLVAIRSAGADADVGVWRRIVERAVARGEATSAALHPRVATLPLVLLRNEYVTHGLHPVADSVLVEIVDAVYLPLAARGQ
jgi:AcrR family transcriptional regulator